MNRERYIEILRNDFNIQNIKSNSQGWVKVNCVLPGHKDLNPSAAFNINNGIYFCFGCHITTNIYKLISKFKNISYKDAVKYIDGEIEIEQPPLENLKNRNLTQKYNRVENKKININQKHFNIELLTNPEEYHYTKSHGFTTKFCKEFNVQKVLNGFYKDYFLIPIKNKYYNLDTFEARKLCQIEYLRKWFGNHYTNLELNEKFSEVKKISKLKIKNGVITDKDNLQSTNPTLLYLLRPKVLYEANSILKSIIWNIDNLDYNEDLIICEGLGSIPKIYQYYSKNVTCTFGSQVSNEQILLLRRFKGKKIFLSDWDEASYSELIQIRHYIEDAFVFSQKTEDTEDNFIDKLKEGYIEISRFLMNIFYS